MAWVQLLTGAEEEIFDTVLLVIRNAVQFLRLGNILRRYVSFLLSP